MALFGKKKPAPPVTGQMTLLHSEVQGFVILGEHLSAQEIFDLLHDYLWVMHRMVLDYDGELVCPGSADNTTAVFSGEDHARRATRAAVGMMTALQQLHIQWQDMGRPQIETVIGLHSGGMSVGSFGLYPTPHRFALGDNANFACRLTGLNRFFGTHLLLSESTHTPLAAECTARELDLIMVKGRKAPLHIFELWSMAPATDEQESRLLHWDKGLAAYRTQRWDAAIESFSQLANDFAASAYLQRCEAYKANPPGDDWDGVWTMTVR